ncbi:unnamed protein product [Hapterophycus canaliculatus]
MLSVRQQGLKTVKIVLVFPLSPMFCRFLFTSAWTCLPYLATVNRLTSELRRRGCMHVRGFRRPRWRASVFSLRYVLVSREEKLGGWQFDLLSLLIYADDWDISK